MAWADSTMGNYPGTIWGDYLGLIELGKAGGLGVLRGVGEWPAPILLSWNYPGLLSGAGWAGLGLLLAVLGCLLAGLHSIFVDES